LPKLKEWSTNDESQKVHPQRKNILRIEHTLDIEHGFGDDCGCNYSRIIISGRYNLQPLAHTLALYKPAPIFVTFFLSDAAQWLDISC